MSAKTAQSPAPRRRRWPFVLGVVAVAVGALGAVGAVKLPERAAEAEQAAAAAAAATAAQRQTAQVQRRDIVTTTSLAGTLTYADARSVQAGTPGTITWLPESGASIEPGQPLFAVDGQPVVLLAGDLPMWRNLSEQSDDGQDVAVLEQALIALGVADEASMTVDETFTSSTATAVAALRAMVGLSEGEAINLGDVVYRPSAVRIAGIDVQVGDRIQAGTSVLTATAPDRIVTVDLDSSEQGLLVEGNVVEVELPDNTTVDGTVTYVSAVAVARTSGGQTTTTTYVVPLEITLASGGAAFDEAPVDITVTSKVATGVLAAPVEALLALAEGGYALEVVLADGTTELVAVQIGDFSDGWVAVSGEAVVEGLEVITA
ncbi:MAG: biotin carboxyl carrier protein [Glaciecola sp.]|jgi:biotin carboxyl carrier protein